LRLNDFYGIKKIALVVEMVKVRQFIAKGHVKFGTCVKLGVYCPDAHCYCQK
jgi:hypothetical protein